MLKLWTLSMMLLYGQFKIILWAFLWQLLSLFNLEFNGLGTKRFCFQQQEKNTECFWIMQERKLFRLILQTCFKIGFNLFLRETMVIGQCWVTYSSLEDVKKINTLWDKLFRRSTNMMKELRELLRSWKLKRNKSYWFKISSVKGATLM